ncbi:ankyrin repeat protein [Leptospira kirschneri str. 2008720114]|uniref:ankyrin repeat domain-containing protein n=1 Tax=Leptospira kirschneri TaxID=29507 RepID=UPI0002983365|nr:ankyrin repeat domain-containing protein [Leptospira kirschneri]EKP06434.1 ankyrin repeat protein [Leptospira kirschneri str. 2008720114]
MKDDEKSNERRNFTKIRPDSLWKRFLFFNSIRSGNVKRIRNLLQNGFNPNLNFYHGITSLSIALKYHRLEIVQVLIEYRADTNLVDQSTGFTPLIHSILENDFSLDMMFVLIRNGADLDRKDERGMSPLHHCVNEGKLEALRFLLERGADPNAQDRDGVTCIHLAKSSQGMSEFVELLLKYGADPTIQDKYGKTYLM